MSSASSSGGPAGHLRNPSQLCYHPGDVRRLLYFICNNIIFSHTVNDNTDLGNCDCVLLHIVITLFFFFLFFSFLHNSADQGRLLDYIVSWGNLTEEKVSLYLRDILEALHYLHTCRIAHLDLKVSLSIELFLINL